MLLESWEQDPEFAQLSKEEKKNILVNYFDSEMADDEFRSLSIKDQDEIKVNFLQSEGIRPDLTFSRVIKQAAAEAAQGLGNIVRYMKAAEDRASFDEVVEKDPYMMSLVKKSTPEEIEQYRLDYEKRQANIKRGMEGFVEKMPEPKPGSSGIIEDAARGMAQFLPAMGISALSPMAGVVVTFSTLGGSKFKEFKDQGIDDDTAFVAATLSAAAQTPIEFLGNLFQINSLKHFAKPFFKGAVNNKAIKFLWTMAKNAGAEGLEEYLQQYPDELSNLYAANPDASPQEIWDEFKRRFPEIRKSAYEAAKVGAVGGAMLAGIGGVITAPAQLGKYRIQQKEEQVTEETPETKGIPQQVYEDLSSGKITETELRNQISSLEKDDDLRPVLEEGLNKYIKEQPTKEKKLTPEDRQKIIEREMGKEEGEQVAETIRGDEGQVQERGIERQGREEEGREDLQRPGEEERVAPGYEEAQEERIEEPQVEEQQPKVRPFREEVAEPLRAGEKRVPFSEKSIPDLKKSRKKLRNLVKSYRQEGMTEDAEKAEKAIAEVDRVIKEKSAPETGRKPSQDDLANLLINKGLMRAQDKGKKQYAYTFRKAIPNNKWLSYKEIFDRLWKPGKDAGGALTRTLQEWANNGILERRWLKDGDTVYAWKGTEPTKETFTESEIDKLYEQPSKPEVTEQTAKPKAKQKALKPKPKFRKEQRVSVREGTGEIGNMTYFPTGWRYDIHLDSGDIINGENESVIRPIIEPGTKPEAKPEAKPYRKPIRREPKGLEDVKNLRAAILKLGQIKQLNMTGEVRKMGMQSRMMFSQKKGMPYDRAEQMLKDAGWLDRNESIFEVLRDPANLKRGRLTRDIGEKAKEELTPEDIELKKQMEHESEAPPEGEYTEIRAEDLPEGKEFIGITPDGKWDQWHITEKDSFGVTLRDGTTIELKPGDKVQVLKSEVENRSQSEIKKWTKILNRPNSDGENRLRRYLASLALGRNFREKVNDYYERRGLTNFINWAYDRLNIEKEDFEEASKRIIPETAIRKETGEKVTIKRKPKQIEKRELKISDVPSDLMVNISATRETTGEVVKIRVNARKALQETEGKLEEYYNLKACL